MLLAQAFPDILWYVNKKPLQRELGRCLVFIGKEPRLHFSQITHEAGRTLEVLPKRSGIDANVTNSGLGFVLIHGLFFNF